MYKNKRAFTLIELLVVVLIIGILSAIALPQYRLAVLKARYTQLMTSVASIKTAIIAYHLANNTYPTTWEDLDISLPGTINGNELVADTYTCIIYTDNPNMANSLTCRLRTNNTTRILAYRWMYPPDNKNKCEASLSDNIENQVCKSLGGILEQTDSRNVYILP